MSMRFTNPRQWAALSVLAALAGRLPAAGQLGDRPGDLRRERRAPGRVSGTNRDKVKAARKQRLKTR